MAIDVTKRTIDLVDEALRDIADDGVLTSTVVEKATRIARLRRDGRNLVWLTMEGRSIGDEAAKACVADEVRPYFSSEEELRGLWSDAVEAFIAERKVADPEGERMAVMTVREMEVHLGTLANLREDVRDDQRSGRDYSSIDLDIASRTAQVKQILARIRGRIHDYLSRVEQELVVGGMVSSIFEEQRIYVDQRLRDVAPEAFDQLAAAYRRHAEDDVEARSQALTSCRRALKSVSDAVYPAHATPVIGADGKERVLTDQMFVSRLLQYAFERRKGSATVDADVLRAEIAHLADRLEALKDLSSKGVHANVSTFEVNQAVIQTYLAIADIMRLRDYDAAAETVSQTVSPNRQIQPEGT
jgi:hypothetical protein